MEEHDAVTDADVEDQKSQDSTKTKASPGKDFLSASEEMSGSTGSVADAASREDTPNQGKADALSLPASEKKVRFSEDLTQGAHTKQVTQDSASSESNTSFLKASSSNKIKHEVQGPHLVPSAEDDSVVPQQAPETECTKKDILAPTVSSSPPAEKACASLQESSVQPVELAKCNISNISTGMLQLQWP